MQHAIKFINRVQNINTGRRRLSVLWLSPQKHQGTFQDFFSLWNLFLNNTDSIWTQGWNYKNKKFLCGEQDRWTHIISTKPHFKSSNLPFCFAHFWNSLTTPDMKGVFTSVRKISQKANLKSDSRNNFFFFPLPHLLEIEVDNKSL